MEKYKIGYTSGVFDLFHVGHLNILKQAKEYCEYLIAAVSTDELCFEYKHRNPVISFAERFAIVEAIRYVDKTVTQYDMNKLEAWDKYKFNVLFHGSDWENTVIYKRIETEMENLGVDVVYFPYTKNVSSSAIRERVPDKIRIHMLNQVVDKQR